MENTLFKWLLDIPQTIASFGNWLVSPLAKGYIDISPLALLSVAGVSIIVVIIGVHIVRLFI